MTVDPEAWLARAPHLTIATAPLPDGEMGRWIPSTQTILLSPDLTATERRCTLVHELVHRLHKDDPNAGPFLRERQERECRKRSAKLLIRLNDLLQALVWTCTEHEEELACHLDVDVSTLRDRLEFLTDEDRYYLIRRLRIMREESA